MGERRQPEHRSRSGSVENPKIALAREAAAAMWAADRASRQLGMRLLAVGPGHASLEMVVLETMLNGHGICHGAYVFALADSAFAFACNSRGGTVVAAGAEIEFLSPVHLHDRLRADATERVVRGRSGIYDVTVRQSSNKEVVAEFRGRSRSVDPRRQLAGAVPSTPPEIADA